MIGRSTPVRHLFNTRTTAVERHRDSRKSRRAVAAIRHAKACSVKRRDPVSEKAAPFYCRVDVSKPSSRVRTQSIMAAATSVWLIQA